MSKDYYKILGITEFNTTEEIKSAYRRLARKFHPDIAGNSAENLFKFKEINEAYEILTDKVKKEEYDKARKFYNYVKEGSVNSTQRPKNNYSSSINNEKSFNWKDILKNTKYRKNTINNPQKGEDIESEIEVSYLEAINGCTKTINMLKTEVCQHCKGNRFINGMTCPKCHGKGEFTVYKKFNVSIPAGIKNNSKIRLAGEGNTGKFGGQNGDIYLKILIKDICSREKNNLDIYKTIPISPYEAVLGGNISVHINNEIISFKLAPNTQNGQKIRLSKCGIVQNNKIGDMIITIEIQIPKKITIEELNLYKKLSEISSNNLRDEFYDR